MWSDLDIREAKMEDASALCSIYNQYLGEATMDLDAVQPGFYEYFITNKSDKEKLYLLHTNEKVIAYSQIKKYSHKKGYQYTCETSTFFDKAYRNKGYGTKFKKFVMAECSRLNYKHIVARILSVNKVSVDYNLKLGYEIVGIQEKVGFVDGVWHDIVIMQYLIDQGNSSNR